MKKISTLFKNSFLLLSFLFLSTQVYGQVAGSFGIYNIPSRFGAVPMEYFKNNGFETNIKVMVETTITSNGTEANLSSVRAWLTKYYPGATNTGWLILDWETGPYDALRDYPKGSPQFVKAENEMLKLINDIKDFRPNVKVSIYQMPFRASSPVYNDLFNETGKFDNIFARLDFICPSIYIINPDEEVGHTSNIDYIKFNLDVSLPLGKKFNKPVIPFFWHKIHPLTAKYGNKIMQKEVFAKYIKYISSYSLHNTKAAGMVWWDGVSDKLADLGGINDCLKGTVTDEASYDAMIVDYAKYVKQELNNTDEITITDKVAPEVTGIIDGGLYNVNKKITFNEGTATLNNTVFKSNSSVSAEGTYILVVTDVAGNVTTIRFAIDKTRPTGTLLINNNAKETTTVNVTLNLTYKGEAVEMRFDKSGVWTGWEPVAATKAWTLAASNGTKSASVQFRDAASNISASAYDLISLKQAATTPEDKTKP